MNHADIGNIANHKAGLVHVAGEQNADRILLGTRALKHDRTEFVVLDGVGDIVKLGMHDGADLALAASDSVGVAQGEHKLLVHR